MAEPQGEGASAPAADGRLGRVVEGVIGGCAAVVLFLIMILTFVDVVGRDVFDAPLPGAFEVTQIMMAVLIFVTLPVVSRREEHVVIDLLDSLTPDAVARWRQVVVNLAGAAALGVIAWRTWALAIDLQGYNEVTEYLRLPVAPVVYLIGVLSGLAALAHLANAWLYLRGRARQHAGGSAA